MAPLACAKPYHLRPAPTLQCRDPAPASPPFHRPGDVPAVPEAESTPAHKRPVATKRKKASRSPWDGPLIRSRAEILGASTPSHVRPPRAATPLRELQPH